MYNKHTTALYAAVISSVLVASVFAISFVQQALAQGNTTGGAAGGNMTGGNMTGGAAGGNMSSGGSSGGA
jgi:hypothetical protein